MKIERAKKADYAEMMDFLHRCFRSVVPEHDRFETLFPDLYIQSTDSMEKNYVIRAGGKIVSMAGLFPLDVKLGDIRLRVAGVGGVCTAPEHRGKGGMTALMTYVRERIASEGYPMAWLSGERDRYLRFGWEKAGTDFVVRVLKLQPDESALKWKIAQLDPQTGSLERIIAARDAATVKGLCDDDALRRKLQRLQLEVWEATLGPGYAYAAVNRKGSWFAEWGGDVEGVRALLRHAFERCGGLSLRMPPVRDAYTDMLLSYAHDYTGPLDNLAVFNLVALLKAYRPHIEKAWPGDRSLRLVIEGEGGAAAGIVAGKPTTRSPRDAFQVRLPAPRMASFLFGPNRPSVLMNLPPEARWLDGVFPLPFGMPALWRV